MFNPSAFLVSKHGTHRAQNLAMPKYSYKITWTCSVEIPAALAISDVANRCPECSSSNKILCYSYNLK